MPHAIMTACGVSLLHRAKYHKLRKSMKGTSAVKKDPEPEMMPAVMPRRALKFR